MEKMLVRGVACDKNTARIAVIGVKDEPGIAFRLFNAVAKKNINVDNIIQSVGREGTKDISFTVQNDDADDVIAILESIQDTLGFARTDIARDVAKVSIVGAGIMTNSGVASKMFEALYDAGINIRMIFTSEIRVSVLVDEKYADKAMNVIHEKFGLAE